MPVELIMVLLSANVILLLFVMWLWFGKRKRAQQTGEGPKTILDNAANMASRNAITLSEIESFIINDGNGNELTLARPDTKQLAKRKYREICVRASSAAGNVMQGVMPALAQVQTLKEIAKVAPDGLFTATGSVQDLMKYSDGTVASFTRTNGHFGTHSGFAEVAVSVTTNPAVIIGGAMQAMAFVSGQYYMNEISQQLESVGQKLDKLIGYHHDEKVGILKSVNQDLCDLVAKVNVDAADIITCQRLAEKCNEVFFEYHTRLEGAAIDTKERWLNKSKELRELGESIEANELNFSIQMCYQASKLHEKCKLAEITIRMKIGDGQERFITEQIGWLQRNSDTAFHHNIHQHIEAHYTPVLERADRIAEAEKIPLLFGDALKEAGIIKQGKESMLNSFGADDIDGKLASSLIHSLSKPQEMIVLLDDTLDTGRVFVLDEEVS